MSDLLPVCVSTQAEARLPALDDDAALAVLHELNKLSAIGMLAKERKAVLNDRFDIYILEPDLVPPHPVILYDPNERCALLAELAPHRPNATQAATWAALAAGIVVRSIHVIG